MKTSLPQEYREGGPCAAHSEGRSGLFNVRKLGVGNWEACFGFRGWYCKGWGDTREEAEQCAEANYCRQMDLPNHHHGSEDKGYASNNYSRQGRFISYMTTKEQNVLRCYVCGKPVTKAFCIATMSNDTDRVFVFHNKCSKQLENGTYIIRLLRAQLKSTKHSGNETSDITWLTEKERTAVFALCDRQQLSVRQLLRQALRVYERHVLGVPDLGPKAAMHSGSEREKIMTPSVEHLWEYLNYSFLRHKVTFHYVSFVNLWPQL